MGGKRGSKVKGRLPGIVQCNISPTPLQSSNQGRLMVYLVRTVVIEVSDTLFLDSSIHIQDGCGVWVVCLSIFSTHLINTFAPKPDSLLVKAMFDMG